MFAPVAVYETGVVKHTLGEDAVIVMTGTAFAVTEKIAADKHPAEFFPSTVYVVFTTGAGVITVAVEVVFQVYEVAPEAVRVVVCPAQIVDEEPLMETVGVGLTVIDLTAELEQLPAVPTTL